MRGFSWKVPFRARFLWVSVLGVSFLSCLDNSVPEPIPDPTAPVPRLKSVAYWDFNDCTGGTLRDKSGNGLDGKIKGAVCAEGIQGNALRFNGSTDFVDMGKASLFDLDSNMSISAWVSPSDMAAQDYWYEIAAKRTLHNSAYGLAIKVGGRTAPYIQWYFGDGASFLIASAVVPLADETWTHIVVTREIMARNSRMSFYANGKLVKSSMLFGLPEKSPQSPFTLGRNSDPIANPASFKGRIDEVSVYDSVLDSATVAGIYKAAKP